MSTQAGALAQPLGLNHCSLLLLMCFSLSPGWLTFPESHSGASCTSPCLAHLSPFFGFKILPWNISLGPGPDTGPPINTGCLPPSCLPGSPFKDIPGSFHQNLQQALPPADLWSPVFSPTLWMLRNLHLGLSLKVTSSPVTPWLSSLFQDVTMFQRRQTCRLPAKVTWNRPTCALTG